MFDLDGTLLDPGAALIDEECYWRAIAATFRVPYQGREWVADVRHVTCVGVASGFCEERFGRQPAVGELDRMRTIFLQNLTNSALNSGQEELSTHGALKLLDHLSCHRGYEWAVATGCFGSTARYKLERSGLRVDNLILATCDDGCSRPEIMQAAVRQAEARHGHGFSQILHVGDGLWDIAAARDLGWPFIGIASGEDASRLRRAGTRFVAPHFAPIDRFMTLIEKAFASNGRLGGRSA